jgi:tetratricopeptide (TPR) repeat protein
MSVMRSSASLGGLLVCAACGVGGASAQGQLEPDDLAGPKPEVVAAAALELPSLPSFELPATELGFVSARELRVRGRRHLEQPVKLKGYVTWIYDCAASLAAKNPKAKKAAIQKAVAADPSLCDEPRLAIGDGRGHSRDESVLVVDVPRPPRKASRPRRGKEAPATSPAAPTVAVGDYVSLAAQWTAKWRGKRGAEERAPEGVLVYGALERIPAPAVEVAPARTSASASRADADTPPFVVTKAPLRKAVPVQVRATSIALLGECTRATAAGELDAAIRACRQATATWEGNHLAWYTLSSAHMAKGQWPEARATVARSVALRPDLAMYQLYHGVAIYEEELQATGAGLGKPLTATSAPSAGLVAARDALRRAARLNPALWRAHFYLGRVYRDLDDARRAAEQLAATVRTHPTYRYGYVALIELLRRWGYLDEALAFAKLGAQQVPGAEAAELWIEVGLLGDARRADAQAIEAFGKALALVPGDGRALLQRGQVLYRIGDLEGARRDLTGALQSQDPRLVSARPFMQELLDRIAAKKKP